MLSRVRLPGTWTFNSTIAPAEFEKLDGNAASGVDGFLGGTYSPSALITIGGSGLTVAGPFNASDAKIISVDTTLTIELGANLLLTGNQLVNSGAGVGILSGAFLTVSSGGTFTMNSGSTANIAATTTLSGTNTLSGATTISGALTCSNTVTLTKGVTITQSTADTNAITATGNGTGAGASCTGGATGPGIAAVSGTPSSFSAPTCAASFAGYIEMTADDPAQTVVPPAENVFYGLSGCKAFCMVLVGTGGPYLKADSHNIDVVDDVSAGVYSVTFLRPMLSAAYTVVFGVNVLGLAIMSSTKTTGGFRFTVFDTNTKAAVTNPVTVDLQVFGRR